MQVFVIGSFVVACSVKVTRLPRAGESLDAAAFISEPGGKGFNLALASHRLGVPVAGVFAVGDDVFGAVAEAAFGRGGLNTEMLIRHAGSTGAGIGFIDDSGENCLAVSLGANRLLSVADVERAGGAVEASRLVMATFESPDAAILAGFAHARSQGIPTMLNPSPTRPIPPEILTRTSILIVNQVEAEDLGIGGDRIAAGGDPDRSRLDLLGGEGLDLLVVTLGERGAAAFPRCGPPIRQGAFAVPVIDTIGAGDAFAAGLAVSLVQRRPVEEAMRRAAACGALSICLHGAFDSFPTATALERFLAGTT